MKNEKTILPKGKNWNDFKTELADWMNNSAKVSIANGEEIVRDFPHILMKDFDEKVKYNQNVGIDDNPSMNKAINHAYNCHYAVEYIDTSNGKQTHKIYATTDIYPDYYGVYDIIEQLKKYAKSKDTEDWKELNEMIEDRGLSGGKIDPKDIKLINGKRFIKDTDFDKSIRRKGEYNVRILNNVLSKINEDVAERKQEQEEEGYAKGGILNKKVSFRDILKGK